MNTVVKRFPRPKTPEQKLSDMKKKTLVDLSKIREIHDEIKAERKSRAANAMVHRARQSQLLEIFQQVYSSIFDGEFSFHNKQRFVTRRTRKGLERKKMPTDGARVATVYRYCQRKYGGDVDSFRQYLQWVISMALENEVSSRSLIGFVVNEDRADSFYTKWKQRQIRKKKNSALKDKYKKHVELFDQ